VQTGQSGTLSFEWMETYVTHFFASCVSQLVDQLAALDKAIVGEACYEFAVTVGIAGVNCPDHLIPNECRECKTLIIDLIKGVLPKGVEDIWTDEETSHRHP